MVSTRPFSCSTLRVPSLFLTHVVVFAIFFILDYYLITNQKRVQKTKDHISPLSPPKPKKTHFQGMVMVHHHNSLTLPSLCPACTTQSWPATCMVPTVSCPLFSSAQTPLQGGGGLGHPSIHARGPPLPPMSLPLLSSPCRSPTSASCPLPCAPRRGPVPFALPLTVAALHLFMVRSAVPNPSFLQPLDLPPGRPTAVGATEGLPGWFPPCLPPRVAPSSVP